MPLTNPVAKLQHVQAPKVWLLSYMCDMGPVVMHPDPQVLIACVRA